MAVRRRDVRGAGPARPVGDPLGPASSALASAAPGRVWLVERPATPTAGSACARSRSAARPDRPRWCRAACRSTGGRWPGCRRPAGGRGRAWRGAGHLSPGQAGSAWRCGRPHRSWWRPAALRWPGSRGRPSTSATWPAGARWCRPGRQRRSSRPPEPSRPMGGCWPPSPGLASRPVPRWPWSGSTRARRCGWPGRRGAVGPLLALPGLGAHRRLGVLQPPRTGVRHRRLPARPPAGVPSPWTSPARSREPADHLTKRGACGRHLEAGRRRGPAAAGDQSWSLDGTWDLLPGDHEPGALGGLEPLHPGLARGPRDSSTWTASPGTGAGSPSTTPAATGRCASRRSWTWPRCT